MNGRLHTVCQSARCPNIWECFSGRIATFLILGDRCTRACGFCAISHGLPHPPDPEEPQRVADAAGEMGLEYVVVTSVTRDDLPDGGSGLFVETIRNIRRRIPDAKVEVLIPDFMGNQESLRRVLDAQPDVLNHNLETAAPLYGMVRPQASYGRSLDLLRQASAYNNRVVTKSGLMLGIGESDDDILKTLADLRDVNCTSLTMGQYLQPSGRHLPVHRYISPETFETLRQKALDLGFRHVASGPFVRSSYHAGEMHRVLTIP